MELSGGLGRVCSFVAASAEQGLGFASELKVGYYYKRPIVSSDGRKSWFWGHVTVGQYAFMCAVNGGLPALDSPPLIETVLGVQFAPIVGFTSGHFGWYWKKFLGPDWVKTAEVPPLPDQFENFGERTWQLPFSKLRFMESVMPDRLQIINSSDDHVIQVQNTRFLYNWRKREATYPRFKILFPEFTNKLDEFCEFLRTAGLNDIVPNQWEVTYINHIPKGELWSSLDDFGRIFPGLSSRFSASSQETRLESVTGEWHFEIEPERGRLHVNLQHGKLNEGKQELLVVQLTARGPINAERSGWDLASGLQLGHHALVRTFFDACSQAALDHWGVRKP